MNKLFLSLFVVVLLGLTWQQQPTPAQADWTFDLSRHIFIPQVHTGRVSDEAVLTPSQVMSWCLFPCQNRGVFVQPAGAPKHEVIFGIEDCFIDFQVPTSVASTTQSKQFSPKVYHVESTDGLIHIDTGPTAISDPCWALFRLDIPAKQSLALSIAQVRSWCTGRLCESPAIQQPGDPNEIAYFPGLCGPTTLSIPTNWSYTSDKVKNQTLLVYYGTARTEVLFLNLQSGAPVTLSNVCWAYFTLRQI